MQTRTKRGDGRREPLIQSSALGTTRIPADVRDALVHPDATPLQEVVKDDSVDVALSKIENLLGKGHFGAALREIDAVKIGDTPLAGEYEFIRQDKTARANLGIANRYFIRGDAASARKFYEQAIEVATADPTVKGIAETAGTVFDTLLQQRTALIQGLQESIRTSKFDEWCGQKRDLDDVTVLDDVRIREQVAPDYYLERVFQQNLRGASRPLL